MKGAIVGGAIASLQHPNYIVNTGSATADDVRKLAMDVKIAVHTAIRRHSCRRGGYFVIVV